MKLYLRTLTILGVLCFSIQTWAQVNINDFIKPYVIYGDDNRKDYYEVQDSAQLDLADSTVALFNKMDVKIDVSSGVANLKEVSYRARYGLCETEAFVEQKIGAFCSGFLVGPDLIATAGHCIAASGCSDVSFVFGYRMTSAISSTSQVPAGHVYNCKEVISHEDTSLQDYALVRVDRVVTNAKPLKLSSTPVMKDDKLLMIGHPAGLPVKIADEAVARESREGYFVASTDSYGGNSGSAVFNRAGEVVGILVRGEADFVYNYEKQCLTSNKCAENSCRGEDITFISYIQKALEKLGEL